MAPPVHRAEEVAAAAATTTTATTTPEMHGREYATDATSGDDEDADPDTFLLDDMDERLRAPKEFQRETTTDWRSRMQSRLQQLQERTTSVVYAVPDGQVISAAFVRCLILPVCVSDATLFSRCCKSSS